MKVQYFGDVTDYRKYALLRLLAKSGGFKIGVCWMLTPTDDRTDGNKRSFIQQPAKWRAFDPDLFNLLATVTPKPDLTDLQRVESEGLIPDATFVSEPVPDARQARLAFHQRCLSAFSACDLAFFDPDNGLEIKSRPKGRKNSSKFVFGDEVSDHCAAGRSVLIYQHYPRRPRKKFLADMTVRLSEALPQASIWFFQTPHVVFALAARSEHAQRAAAVVDVVVRMWPAQFMKPERHAPSES